MNARLPTAFFRALGHVAFEKMVCDDSRIVFDEEELNDARFGIDVERAMRVGLLTCDAKSQTERSPLSHRFAKSPQRRFVFLHRTFQEFFAAFFASDYPTQFGESVSRMQFKAFISNQFLIFLAGFLNSEKLAIMEILIDCLRAKDEFTTQSVETNISSIRQRQRQFPNALSTEELASSRNYNYGDAFLALFAQVQNEVEEDKMCDQLFKSYFFVDDSESVTCNGLILSELLASARRFALPRGYRGSIRFLRVGGFLFRAGIVTKPILSVMLSQQTNTTKTR